MVDGVIVNWTGVVRFGSVFDDKATSTPLDDSGARTTLLGLSPAKHFSRPFRNTSIGIYHQSTQEILCGSPRTKYFGYVFRIDKVTSKLFNVNIALRNDQEFGYATARGLAGAEAPAVSSTADS